MNVLVAHARLQALELLRYPAFVFPTIALPALFFLLFAVARADPADAEVFMALYAAFAVLGVAFFQFGVGIAAERASPWEVFLRALPAAPLTRFAARLVVGLSFAAAAALAVVVVALATTPAHLPAARWPLLAGALLAGGVPFGLLGIAIGYLTSPRAALPLANVLYLLLAYAGGLWTRPEALPVLVSRLSPYLPTRQWADLLTAVATGDRPPPSVAGLGAYTVAFGLLALAAYQRDEGARFA
jgi:ABC-2 type transport system permease protein